MVEKKLLRLVHIAFLGVLVAAVESFFEGSLEV